MNKKTFSILMLFSTILYLQPVLSEAKVYKFATLMPENSPGQKEFRKSIKQLEEQTDGRVSLKVYYGGIAGDEVDVIRKMRVDRVQAGAFTGIGMGHILPGFRVLELPGLFISYDEEDYVKRKMFDLFAAEFEKKGFVLLGIGSAGFAYIFSMHNVVDFFKEGKLKDLKMWCWKGDALSEICYRELGMNMFPLHIGDVYVGLQTGLIDTFVSTTMASTAFQWYLKAKYIVDYPSASVAGGILSNKSSFYVLSKKDQDLLRKMGQEISSFGVKTIRKMNYDARIVLKDAGVKFIDPPPAQVKYVAEGCLRAVEKCIAQGLFSKELIDQAISLTEEYRKMNPDDNWKSSFERYSLKGINK